MREADIYRQLGSICGHLVFNPSDLSVGQTAADIYKLSFMQKKLHLQYTYLYNLSNIAKHVEEVEDHSRHLLLPTCLKASSYISSELQIWIYIQIWKDT